MTTRAISPEDQVYAQERFETYYKGSMIPRDKKPYAIDLRSGRGPYMGVDSHDGEPSFFLDASSQIASLGLGLNPTCFFGTAQFLEAWINNTKSRRLRDLERALRRFLERKMGCEGLFVSYCNSGAEANETALGFCFENRRNPKARKILAFEGSFHGRMMATLAATWNPAKRMPFEWPGFSAHYCPYPEISDDVTARDIPAGWREGWDECPSKSFRPEASWSKTDADAHGEVESLMTLREQLLTGDIFAIIVEPMQCEGGDRYSSGRFHTALLIMARAFGVPVVYDEVQTGFHLGREFFWHRSLDLKDSQGRTLRADYTTCAKKSQVGMVISQSRPPFAGGPPHAASLIRGYYQGFVLDQSCGYIRHLEEEAKRRLQKLVKRYAQFIARPRAQGLAFAFDVLDKSKLNAYVAERFDHGLLYYPAGDRTLRFRLNRSFKKADLDHLFKALDAICAKVNTGEEMVPHSPPAQTPATSELFYRCSSFIADAKYRLLRNLAPITRQDVSSFFERTTGRKLLYIDAESLPRYEKAIMELQKKVYEPLRISPIERYRAVLEGDHGLALAIAEGDNLAAMSFASPLSDHPLEPGVGIDPHFGDDGSLYCIDTTVDPSLGGRKIGLALKYALSALALAEGAGRLQGRNRDRLASAMLEINFSLGAYEQDYRREDYADALAHRDTIYYSAELPWRQEAIDLSGAIASPLGSADIDPEYMDEQMPCLVNKICLSNFVGIRYLSHLKEVFSSMPKPLRHGYSAGGQSECVDKIAKSLWFKSEKKTCRMLTFADHSFGTGSFLARTLSGQGDAFFHADHLRSPTPSNYEAVIEEVEKSLKRERYLAVWIEPVVQKTMAKTPEKFLASLRDICLHHKTALVYNETASQFYRYDGKRLFACRNEALGPDAVMFSTGGQSAMVAIDEKFFVADPLMMISTWDGDEFSLSNYRRALLRIEDDPKAYLETCRLFEEKLKGILGRLHGIGFQISGSRGFIQGPLPERYSRYFDRRGDGYVVCANYSHMQRFLKEAP